MDNITITIKLFGAFRKYGETLNVTCPSPSSIYDIKNIMADLIDDIDRALVYESAIANDNKIIGNDTVFTEDSNLAILPPVCGG